MSTNNASAPPEAEISNGVIQAKLFLPDAGNGYYRGTRFDWSGIIHSLKCGGHDYFGRWFEHYDPTTHDCIMGPVEEFRTNGAGLGYAEAEAGGTFIRIGVGVVRKPVETGYRMSHCYDIIDPGKWTVKVELDRIGFTHELADGAAYAYQYHKTIRLVENQPLMVIEHLLKNRGLKAINTTQYNHNFFVMDGLPTNPGCTVTFPFKLRAVGDMRGLAEIRGNQLVYLRELQTGERAGTKLEGFGSSATDYQFTLEHRKARAGVKVTGDQPLSELYFWSVRTTICPEPKILLHVEPGHEAAWKIAYEFYDLDDREEQTQTV
jgi:hypothetical protein